MKISLNEIKKLVPEATEVETAELIRLIGARLVEVEGSEDWSEKFKGVYVVRVVSAEAIPDTHLHLCQIDAGSAGAEFARGIGGAVGETSGLADDSIDSSADVSTGGLVQVVCGAPNVHAGMLAAWIRPGAIVPATFGMDEPFEIGARKLRGYESFGMLAAADELGLGEDHAGIIEIDPKMTVPAVQTNDTFAQVGNASVRPEAVTDKKTIQPGMSLAEAFDLNDIILDIENKSLTHRPDCFGLIGFAREVAGILGVKFHEPAVFELLKTAEGENQTNAVDVNANQTNATDINSTDASAGQVDSIETGKLKLLQETETLDVQIADPALCPRYSAAVIEFEDVPKKSPYFSRTDVFLAKAGMRGISPIVDLTNVIMLETGQPMHAFDYEKFKIVGKQTPKAGATDKNGANSKVATDAETVLNAMSENASNSANATTNNLNPVRPTILVRPARKGEEIILLDGKTVKCNANDILITSNGWPVALAGAMGGKNTEIDETTSKIILESATFSLYNLRKTQMAHGIFSEAITRFTKGQPASLTLPVLTEAVARLGVEPVEVADCRPTVASVAPIRVSAKRVNDLLGTSYPTEEMVRTLENVGFNVKIENDVAANASEAGTSARAGRNAALVVTVPAWRTDVHIPEDVIEEIGRMLGYDNIPLRLPTRTFTGATEDPLLTLKNQLRGLLSERLGMNEVLTYSFVSRKLQEQVGEDPEDSYEIINSISPELQRFRQTITPSLLEKVRDNLKAGFDEFTLYEINQISRHSLGLTVENVPEMRTHLAVVTLGDFYAAKAQLVEMLKGLGVATNSTNSIDSAETAGSNGANSIGTATNSDKATGLSLLPSGTSLPAYFEKLRSAKIGDTGFVGEIRPGILRRLKIEVPVSAFEIDLERLLAAPKKPVETIRISKFPTVSRDLTVKVKSKTAFGAVENIIRRTLENGDPGETKNEAESNTENSGENSPKKEAKNNPENEAKSNPKNGQALIANVKPVSIYQKSPETKNLSFHLEFSNPEKTLNADEISAIMEKIETALAEKFGAEVI